MRNIPQTPFVAKTSSGSAVTVAEVLPETDLATANGNHCLYCRVSEVSGKLYPLYISADGDVLVEDAHSDSSGRYDAGCRKIDALLARGVPFLATALVMEGQQPPPVEVEA